MSTQPTLTNTGSGAHYVGGSLNETAGSYPLVDITFSSMQITPKERKLSELIAEKTANKEFFYGIELAARPYNNTEPLTLDYNSFGLLMPLFTSLIWLGQDYYRVDPIQNVESIRFARKLTPQTVVLPHFTCYRTDRQRLEDFLALNFSNALVLRGDQVSSDQEFRYAAELVALIREIRGNTISIGVGGYPEGHPDCPTIEEDMQHLKQKVNAGADFIITQLCFSAETIINFIKNCRENDIKVPIIVGIYSPESFRTLSRLMEITKVTMSPELLSEYKQHRRNETKFQAFAVQKTLEMITEVFNSGLDVYGLQFFSLNKFSNIKAILQEMNSVENRIE